MTQQNPSLKPDSPTARDAGGDSTKMINPAASTSEKSSSQQVADLMEANAALQESLRKCQDGSRAKSEFVANMIREIRTPLTVILGFAENLETPDLPASDRVDAVNTIQLHAERIRGVVNDFLDLSKLETGKMVIERVACDPIEIIAQAASRARTQAETKGLSLEIEFIGAIPVSIFSAPARIRQILTTLLDNAVRFTRLGKICMTVSIVDREGDHALLQFEITDTGEGMTQDQRDRLFKPFARGFSSTTRRHNGSGMGLAVCQRLTRLLGGDTRLLETTPGTGTRFRATLATGPLINIATHKDPQSALSAAWFGRENGEQPLSGCRVLLVEDCSDNQRLLQHILAQSGADVTLAGNGKIAVEKFHAARTTDSTGDSSSGFDVVLMDMQMPVMDGYEATHQLREQGHNGPIIAWTALAMSGDRDKCLAAGCDDYLAKPIGRQELIATVATHFANQAKWVMPDHAGTPLVSTLADDPEMLPLIEQFVQDLACQVTSIDHAMRADDISALTQVAQHLRSSAGSHGFTPITEAADELASRAASVRSVRLLIPQVESLVILCKGAINLRKTRASGGLTAST